MEPLAQAAPPALEGVDFVLTDVDDTLTTGGRLAARTLEALERLGEAGVRVIPVTAASAGWCSLMIHMWPVAAVIAENGGLYFAHREGGIARCYWDKAESGLMDLAAATQARHPELSLADDQPYRETSLAFRRPASSILPAATGTLAEFGLNTVVNSLWVLAWRGRYDKLAMARRLMWEEFGIDLQSERDRVLYVGDSENDQPMFHFFPHSAGVASVVEHPLEHWPTWIAARPGGEGFVEAAERVLSAR